VAGLIGLAWFTLKMVAFIFFFILLRGALPRYRYDRLMDLGWKVLIPVALVWTLVTATYVLLIEEQMITPTVRLVLFGIAALIVLGLLAFGGKATDEEAPTGLARSTARPQPAPEDREEVGR
jgi:NADH-quinone oxidoreductase subunit H